MSSWDYSTWDKVKKVNESWDYILNTGDGAVTGKEGMKQFFEGYANQVNSPIGSYVKSSDIETEPEWLYLNWWQRVTSALGMMLFPKELEEEENKPTIEGEQEKIEEIKSSVSNIGASISESFGGLFTSFQSVFTSFKGIFPTDTFPTAIKIHGGWSWQIEGGESIPAIEPVNWITDDTPALKTSCDVLRSFFGLIWWLTGFFIMFGIVRGAYSFIVVIVEKCLLVVGSLGRAGGGGGSGV